MKQSFIEDGITYYEGDKIRSKWKDWVTGTIRFGKFRTGCKCDTYTDLQYGFYVEYDNKSVPDASIYGAYGQLWFEHDKSIANNTSV